MPLCGKCAASNNQNRPSKTSAHKNPPAKRCPGPAPVTAVFCRSPVALSQERRCSANGITSYTCAPLVANLELPPQLREKCSQTSCSAVCSPCCPGKNVSFSKKGYKKKPPHWWKPCYDDTEAESITSKCSTSCSGSSRNRRRKATCCDRSIGTPSVADKEIQNEPEMIEAEVQPEDKTAPDDQETDKNQAEEQVESKEEDQGEEQVPEQTEEPAPEPTEEPAPEQTEEPAQEQTEEPAQDQSEEPAQDQTKEPSLDQIEEQTEEEVTEEQVQDQPEEQNQDQIENPVQDEKKQDDVVADEQKPSDQNPNEIEEYEYLQFLIRLTEDILINDYYTNSDMEIVFKSHMESNKGRLSSKIMLQRIDDLKRDLNIPLLSRKRQERRMDLQRCQEELQRREKEGAKQGDQLKFEVIRQQITAELTRQFREQQQRHAEAQFKNSADGNYSEKTMIVIRKVFSKVRRLAHRERVLMSTQQMKAILEQRWRSIQDKLAFKRC